MALLSRHSNTFLQRTTLINYSNLLASPYVKRCRTRISLPAGRGLPGVWHYQCQGLLPACVARGLTLSRGRRNARPEALITRVSRARITLSLVSFTVVLRNVTQCFTMLAPPPSRPVLLGDVLRENLTNDCKRDISYFINFKRNNLNIYTSVRPRWSRLLSSLQPWIIVPF